MAKETKKPAGWRAFNALARKLVQVPKTRLPAPSGNEKSRSGVSEKWAGSSANSGSRGLVRQIDQYPYLARPTRGWSMSPAAMICKRSLLSASFPVAPP